MIVKFLSVAEQEFIEAVNFENMGPGYYVTNSKTQIRTCK